MALSTHWLISRQLRRPSGWYGRTVMARRFRRINTAINAAALEALGIVADDRVLEVGFGPGDLMAAALARVSDGTVTGADFSKEMVKLGRKRFCDEIACGRARIEHANVTAMPFEDATFTKACTVNTVYFWPDLSCPLREFRRVLADGGRLVVAFSPRDTMEPLGVDRSVFTLRDAQEVRASLEDAGFETTAVLPGTGTHGDFVCIAATKRVV